MNRTRPFRTIAAVTASVAVLVATAFVATAQGAVTPVVIGGRYPTAPAVSGARAVWADQSPAGPGNDIYLYDNTTKVTSVLRGGSQDELDPDISGDIVVWTDYRTSLPRVYAYDIRTGVETAVDAVTSGEQVQPSVSGDWIAYILRTSSDRGGVIAVNCVTGERRQLSTSGDMVKVRGSLVVWQEKVGTQWDVYAHDLAANITKVIANSPADELLPATDGSTVAWVRYGDGYDVWAQNVATGGAFVAGGGPGEQTLPSVGGGGVLFLEYKDGAPARARRYDLGTGQVAPFNTYGTQDVAGLDTADGSAVWLMSRGNAQWRVRAAFGATAPTVRASITAATRALMASVGAIARDTQGPEIVSSSFQANARAISTRNPARIVFSERLRPVTAARNVRLTDEAGRPVPARVRYDDRRRAVTVTPSRPMRPGRYRVVIGRGVSDVSGNRMAQDQFLGFSQVTAAIASPGGVVAHVSKGASVTVEWNLTAGAVGYDIYRSRRPLKAADCTPGALVASVGAVSAVETRAASIEASESFTWYYVVVSRDSGGVTSTPSGNACPNPHGSFRTGQNMATGCTRCHAPHGGIALTGKLGALSASACYKCHGSAQGATYGTMTVTNVQGEFDDYPTPSSTGTGTSGFHQHRNAEMVAKERECVSCHAMLSPHKSPYYINPSYTYDPTLSFKHLLEVQISTTPANASVASTDSAPLREGLCFECHGASGATPMAIVAGATSFSNARGDHNEANWGAAATAHGTQTVYPNEYGLSGRGALPGIQCLACHDNHASSSIGMVSYRKTETTTLDAYSQAKLCYACHSASSVETRSAGAKPFSWNGRDVQKEFTRGSAHAVLTTTTAGKSSLTCYSCHNTHYVTKGASTTAAWQVGRVTDPDGAWGSTPASMTAFCMSVGCHGTAAPAITAPYPVAFESTGSWPLFPGWQKPLWANAGHNTTSAAQGQALCESCHDPHGSDFSRLVAWSSSNSTSWAGTTAVAATRAGNTTATMSNVDSGTANSFGRQVSREEALCLQCHGSGATLTIGGVSVPTRKAPGASNVATAIMATYGHPTTSVVGAHSDQETSAGLGVANRHAECVDCHDPHGASHGATSAIHASDVSTAGPALYGAIGIAVNYSITATNWSTPTVSWYSAQVLDGGATDFEAHLCFKCHSSYVSLPTTKSAPSRMTTPTNLAQEFNPYNFSVHNVVGQSNPGGSTKTTFTVKPTNGNTTTVTWALPTQANWLRGGLSPSSKLTCTGCHSNTLANAKGPHGATTTFAIDPAYPFPYRNATMNRSFAFAQTNVICAKCHVLNTNTNAAHSGNSSHATRCIACHSPTPHGWKRPRLITFKSDPVPYRSLGLDGLQVSSHSGSWSASDCQAAGGSGISCSSHSSITSPWP